MSTSYEKVLNFLTEIENVEAAMKQKEAFKNTPEYKLRKIAAVEKDMTKTLVEEAIVDLYGQCVQDTDYDASIPDLRQELNSFIAKQNAGRDKDTIYYVQEAIKKNGKDCPAAHLYENAAKISKAFADGKRAKLAEINIDNLNYEADKEVMQSIQSIGANMDFDEVSDHIRQNVSDTIQKEVDRANAEEDFNQQLQSDLQNDENVNTEAAIDKAVAKAYAHRPKVYEPSLFESIMISKTREHGGDTTNVMTESSREMTLHYIMKTLRLNNYDINNVRKMSSSYLK